MNRRSLIAALAALCGAAWGQKKIIPGTMRHYSNGETQRFDGYHWVIVDDGSAATDCIAKPGIVELCKPHDHSIDSPYWKVTPFGMVEYDRGFETSWHRMQACSICGITRIPPILQKYIGKK